MTYNVFSQTDTLKHVMLGTWFTPDFFDSIKEDAIREPLKRISHEIQEDLENFVDILKEHSIKVMRPNQPQGVFDLDNMISPPICPRDTHHVFGNTCYNVGYRKYEKDVTDVLLEYDNNYKDIYKIIENHHRISMKENKHNFHENIWFSKEKYDVLKGTDWPDFQDYIRGTYTVPNDIQEEIDSFYYTLRYRDGCNSVEGPNIIITNTSVIVDHNEYTDFTTLLQNKIHMDGKEWIHINTKAGHTDGCFVFLNPSTIVGIPNLIDYKGIFGVDNVVGVPWKNYQSQLEDFKKIKQKNDGKWWVKGEESNNRFINFVNNYLSSWTGYAEETVFDVNLLCLDHKHVFVNSNNKDFHNMIKSVGVEPIHVPWRHRFFVDGGLHCITLDIERY